MKDGEKCGLDDFLVANGFPKDIKAAKEALDNMPREKVDPAFPPHLTELGNAIRFELAFNDHLRFVPELKKWIVFDKALGLWKEDNDGEAMRCAKRLPYDLKKEAEKIKDDVIRKSYHAWAKSCESERNLNATLKLASSEAGVILNRDLLDADPWKIAFRNGMSINLQTLETRPISPEDYFMKSFGTIYDPSAKCPRWAGFMHEVMRDDKALVKYIQMVVGLCLTGDMSEQCFFILYGTGANGKSTFLNTLLALFGNYGRQTSSQTFMAAKQDSATRSDLVRLVGVRLVATSETENNQRIAEGLIKQWTGGEQISTRDLYGKTFEFYPQGKILLATNHRPRIHSTDNAIWRRVHLIPFTRTFNDAERDHALADTLIRALKRANIPAKVMATERK
ncbi:MAG: hypothetical protein HY052_08230 [Proteobacteria bacterium]|nr:hypothetical protein [Pseudomonadota bacterium]